MSSFEPNNPNDPTTLMAGRICFVRGQKVMLDSDLAYLHEITSKALALAVRRNRGRFPEDFMFQLTADEAERLQLPLDENGHRRLPYAFTAFGIAMLSSVLNGRRAIELSLAITRELVQSGELSWDNLIAALSPDTPKKRMGAFAPRAGAVNEY